MPRASPTIDDILWNVLEGGPATVNDIVARYERRVRIRLEQMRRRGLVDREGKGGAQSQFTYSVLRSGLAANSTL
jgi:hypothetical protein